MGLKDYWNFGVRHIQVLLLISCAIVNHIVVSGLNAALIMVESEIVPPSNYTLYEDTFKTKVKLWDYFQRNSLANSIYYTLFIGHIVGGILSVKINPKLTLMIVFSILSFFPYFIPILTSSYSRTVLYFIVIAQGFFQGMILPTMAAIIAKWIPYTELARSMSMIVTAPLIGQCILIILGKFLQTSVGGWSSLFYISGNVGVLWVVAWFTFGFPDPYQCFYISTEEKFYIERLTHDIHIVHKDTKIPWKEIFRCRPYYGCLIEHALTTWAYKFILSHRYFHTHLVKALHFSQDKTLYAINVIPVVYVIPQLIVSTAADILRIRESFPLTHLRKTCNSIGLWGSAICIFFIAYITNPTTGLVYYNILLFTKTFYNVGSLLTPFDLAPNFVGLLIGFMEAVGSFPLVFTDLFVNHMIPVQSYEKGWDHIFFLCGISFITGNFIYTILSNDELQKFNKVTLRSSNLSSSVSTNKSSTSA